MRVPRNTALEVFGLKENFSKEELKREYKRLVKIVHPDVGGDENLFKFIETCNNILINREDFQETNNNKSNSYENNAGFAEEKFVIDLKKLDLYYPEFMGKIKKYNIIEIKTSILICIQPILGKNLEKCFVVETRIPYNKFDKSSGILKFEQTIEIPKEMQKFRRFKVRVEFLEDTFKFIVSNGSFKVIKHHKFDHFKCLKTICELNFKN